MSNGIFAGTDLGTTNSATAAFRGNGPFVIKNNLNEEYTPSAVYETRMHGQTVKYIGRRAKEQLLVDPLNVALEFKLKMGMADWRFKFPSTGREVTAVELSAEILRELANSVKQRLGEEVAAMLVTVPAAFTNPMYEATKKAGELAGVHQVELLEEPVAAAWAFAFEAPDIPEAGHWVVYDLGGGTFDTALVRLEGGVFTVFDHDGDQHLGGKDIDAEIVNRYFLPKLPKSLQEAAVPWGSATWWQLKFAAEKAKIELSTEERSVVRVDFSKHQFDFQYILTQEQLVSVQAPTIKKSIEICRRLLGKNSLSPNQVDRLILVGGPTLSPYVRKRVCEEIGIRVDFTVDPLTAVAKGAAIYAKSRPIDRRTPSAAEVKTNLDYPRMTIDPEPLVTGRLENAKGTKTWAGWHVEFSHLDTAGRADWTSGKIAVNAGGVFEVRLRCLPPDRNANERLRENRFRLAAIDPTGREATNDVDTFPITVGLEPGGVQLPRGIGVVKADGSVLWYFDSGQPLPCEKTIPVSTTCALKRGVQSTEVLDIPVVEEGIDPSKGKYNWLIGTLRVRAEKVFTDIPEGSAVEVTIAVDESRTITVSAYFPNYEVEADPMVAQKIELPKRGELSAELDEIKKTLGILESLRGEDEDIRRTLDEVGGSGLVEEAEKLIPQTSDENPDAGQKAKEHLMRLEKLLEAIAGKANVLHEWHAQKGKCVKNVEGLKGLLNEMEKVGRVSAEQRMQFNHLVKQFEAACERRDVAAAEQLAFGEIPGLEVFKDISFTQHIHEKADGIVFPGKERTSHIKEVG